VRLATVCVVALALAQAGQPDRPDRQQPIRVDATLVRVDAYPTRNGQLVEGLQSADFELLEDGVVQKIATFEHVALRRGGPQSARVDPSSQRDMLQAVASSRNRVFAVFLDVNHVTLASGHAINGPLIQFLTEYLGDDDLVGVMTAEMSASQVVFTRRSQAIEEGLRRNWDWGKLASKTPRLDDRENQYTVCFPPTGREAPPDGISLLARKMIARKRERATLEALQDLVRYLHGIREDRKAIVTVTQGWPLYRPDPTMLQLREGETPPGVDRIKAGPTGQLTANDPRNRINVPSDSACEAERSMLAQIDDERFLRDLIDDANRGNATFYTIDPQGLSVSPADRNGAIRTLAENTDGLAAFNSNDLKAGFKRIADDMASYYLLGYYPSNTKPDGRFRSIDVRVKQSGVEVRARRGYQAPTSDEVAASRSRSTAATPRNEAAASVSRALERLEHIRADQRFRVHGMAAVTERGGVLWVAGELQSSGRPDEFAQGATATIEASGAESGPAATRVVLKGGERAFLISLALPAGAKGPFDIRVRLSADGTPGPPLTDAIQVDASSGSGGALLFRRGPTTGNRLVPAADLRFSRTERVRIEIPVAPEASAGAARLLDRGGQPLPVTVTTAERTDPDAGQRWITADLTLAPLGAGDYVVEIGVEGASVNRTLAAIRVVR
jgi:VWFA-related protein